MKTIIDLNEKESVLVAGGVVVLDRHEYTSFIETNCTYVEGDRFCDYKNVTKYSVYPVDCYGVNEVSSAVWWLVRSLEFWIPVGIGAAAGLGGAYISFKCRKMKELGDF